MKFILITIIKFYKAFMGPILNRILGVNAMCRYPLSCSEYAIDAIEKNGTFKGMRMAVKRILTCQPFNQNHEYI